MIGLAALIGAFYQYTETRGFLDEALSAQGLVVDWIEATSSRSGDRGETSYFPVVQFKTRDGRDGRDGRSQADLGQAPMQYKIGETISVLYRPGDLSLVKIDTFVSRWFSVLIPAVLAACFIPAGVFLIKKSFDR